jgi:hypothetical protein
MRVRRAGSACHLKVAAIAPAERDVGRRCETIVGAAGAFLFISVIGKRTACEKKGNKSKETAHVRVTV